MLISSFTPHPTSAFDGWCFVGRDYVSGPQGAAAYETATGQQVVPGEDGCYVAARRTPAGWEIGTDAHGMAKLFVYRRAGTWAVGSSLHELTSHLRAHGVALEPNIPALRGMAIRASLTNQMISRQTVIDGITLVPTYQRLTIGPEGPTLSTPPTAPLDSYEEALAEYLETWRGRLRTLTDDPSVLLSADLSGGMDSRVVFAFLLSVGAADLPPERFRLVSNRSAAEDFLAAQEVARRYGATLNGPVLSRRTSVNPLAALEGWKHSSMGVYLPTYFVTYDPDPRDIQAHGAGGGNYRSAYLEGRRPADIGRFSGRFPPEDFRRWEEQVMSDLAEFETASPFVSGDVQHYRQFRGRLHFGHRPHRRPMFTPLNAAALDRVYDRPGMREDRQVYFDIMESLAPGLMSLPYDKPQKAPTQAARDALTRVDIRADVTGGTIYASRPAARALGASGAVWHLWADEAEAALQDPESVAFMGADAVKQARAAVAELRASRKSPRANALGILEASYALAVHFALGD